MHEPAPLRYRLAVADPLRRLLDVGLRFEAPAGGGPVRASMPAWSPGSYLVREYARHVEGVGARVAGRRLAVRRVTKDAWEVDVPRRGGVVDLSWRVYGNELSVRTNHVDDTHAFVQPTATFLCPAGAERRPLTLDVAVPAGWDVATSLRAVRGARGRFAARDQEDLHDQPVHMGLIRRFPFRVRGVRHELALWGSGNEDPRRLARDMAAIVEAGARLFGGLPYDRYVIHGLLGDAGGGGLEHREGFVFQVPRFRFGPGKEYDRVLSLLAHEFFHAWNVRRIRPAGLLPYDLSAEKYTRLLWQFEGTTSYYAGLLLRRAGLWTAERLLRELAEQATALAQVPGRRAVSLAEASVATWVKFYRPDENSANTTVSYYLKGEMVALALDLHVRAATEGRRSFDDVMRLLWERHGAADAPVPEDGMPGIIAGATGVDVRPLHDALVEGTEDPDWPRLLAPFGIGARVRPAKPPEGYDTTGWCGAAFEDRAGRTVVARVRSDGPAAGRLAAGDEVVAMDGYRAGHESLPRRFADAGPGRDVRFTLLRGDRLVDATVRLAKPPAEEWTFAFDGKAPAAARRLGERWLAGPARRRSRRPGD